MLGGGKYAGRSFEEVASFDRNYCAWILREAALPRSLKTFQNHLARRHGGIMACGKHKGKFFDEVIRDEPDYGQWALGLTEPSQSFKPFITYLESRAEEPPSKKPRTNKDKSAEKQGEEQKQCRICCAAEINSVFVPCGHIMACVGCAVRLEDAPCPVCRSWVAMAIQTYTA